ncbi:predicted protein [Lichtheimia corymbifera JMRC:FSU:9682]|uniref:Uncharacterized protein n=1 Tax=Lichtheimia corymbifera JMRC:FSU:9682 TaxID=1263082 RepID=A0A068SIG4_9FUNG|nr:predicted protein [Lichtheimia corymbifera JMRC:FSU:9682]
MVLIIFDYPTFLVYSPQRNKHVDNQYENMDVDEIAPSSTAFERYRYTAVDVQQASESSSSESSDEDGAMVDQNAPVLQSITANVRRFSENPMTNEIAVTNSEAPNAPAKQHRHVGPNLTEEHNKHILDMFMHNGLPVKRDAEYFQVSPKAVRNIKRKYQQNGNVVPKRKARTAPNKIMIKGVPLFASTSWIPTTALPH